MSSAVKRAMVGGIVAGFLGAMVFAVIISWFPQSWFVVTEQRILLYAAQVPAGIVFVLLGRALARPLRADGDDTLLGIVAGALVFDGLFIGFWPGIYGQEGFALTMTASVLLWAFAWIVIAGLVMNRLRPPRPVDRAGP